MNYEEKSQAKLLKEQLLIKYENGALSRSNEELQAADSFCENYKAFLDKAKTEREAVKTAIELLKQAGFSEYNANKKYNPGDKVYSVNRGKALMAAVIGKSGTKNGVKIAIAHIDSPRLDLKPNPLYEASNLGLFKTHYYGGIKKYQWVATPLAIHGVVIRKDGSAVEVHLGENPNEPAFCVTDLLPHLAQEQLSKPANKTFTGEDLNVLVGSRPFKDDKESELVKLNVIKLLNDKYGIIEADFVSAELELVPAYPSRDVGFDKSMIGGYGQDDRVCAYPALMAAINAKDTEHTVITVLADKEEIGSEGNTGSRGEFVRYFISDLAKNDGENINHVLTKSECLSADVNAAYDPTYASAYEALNSSYINGGVVITKYTGHGGKYDTSDATAEFMGKIRNMLDKENILWQTGELGKVDIGGGGTIAKYIAKLNVDVVDVGVAVLSMHSPFEVVSKLDVHMAYRAFCAFLK
ncbi:MAG: aminopeptidase [Bacillota bacterium]|nr:aminopeptidase [Bacillota bacterium]